MSNINVIQKKGKDHVKYINELAVNLWEQAAWRNDTDFDHWILEAFKLHKKNIEESIEEKKPSDYILTCSRCGVIVGYLTELTNGMCFGCHVERCGN